MKRITKKLLFDLAMALLWAALMIYSLTGAFWHEVLGLAAVGLFGIHIAYNIPKMKREIPRIFTPGKKSLAFRYLTDFALLVFGLFTGLSGVLISQETLTSLNAANLPLWTTLHVWSAYLAVAVIALHIGQHMDLIAAVISKPFRQSPGFARILKSAWNLVIAGIVAYGFLANANVGVSDAETAALQSQADAEDTASAAAASEIVGNAAASESDAQTIPTLSEFLSGLVCTACHRNCPLTAPQCGRGDTQVQSAEAEYEQLYGDAADLTITVGGIDYVSNLS